jgi:ribosomal-protein-serine acetyltransferase
MFTLKVDQDIEIQLFQLQHAEELFHLVDSNRDHLRKWLPWVDSISTHYQYHSIIPMWLQQFADNNGFKGGIRYKGTLVGGIGFHQMDWANSQTSLGYYLSQNAQGYGIMTRSVTALLNYAFYVLKLNRVEIRCGEKNSKSRAIPEKLGFTNEGIIRDGERLHHSFHNLIVYGMVSRDWTKSRII